jgi:hypothetical protein
MYGKSKNAIFCVIKFILKKCVMQDPEPFGSCTYCAPRIAALIGDKDDSKKLHNH